jgi:hypothetical protein
MTQCRPSDTMVATASQGLAQGGISSRLWSSLKALKALNISIATSTESDSVLAFALPENPTVDNKHGWHVGMGWSVNALMLLALYAARHSMQRPRKVTGAVYMVRAWGGRLQVSHKHAHGRSASHGCTPVSQDWSSKGTGRCALYAAVGYLVPCVALQTAMSISALPALPSWPTQPLSITRTHQQKSTRRAGQTALHRHLQWSRVPP